MFPVFLFDSFAPAHLALRANLRLLYRAPAPVLGCVYPSHPWLKKPPIRVCPCFSRLAQAVKNRKKHWFAVCFQTGRCCEKASASPLASVFSTTDSAFVQRINTVIFYVSLFDSFAPLRAGSRSFDSQVFPTRSSFGAALRQSFSTCPKVSSRPAGQPPVAVDSRLPEASHPAGCLGSLPRGRLSEP